MLFIHRPQRDPYFNLAGEEYLLKNVADDCFMVWQNNPSIIIGKHQNAFAEINQAYVYENKIPVIRRISGGGTVFHDPGNLNFSFISTGEREKLIDFRKFTQPIIDFLNSKGIAAKFEGKNDIRVNGLKISGNAEHVFKNKVLHHGTLLFSADLARLNKAIKPGNGKYEDKAVQSLRSKVTNLAGLFPYEMTVEQFRNELISFVMDQYQKSEEYKLSKKEIADIEMLAHEKYETWEWNFAYSPKFTLTKQLSFEGEKITLDFEIQQGIIKTVISDSSNKLLQEFFQRMTGQQFDMMALRRSIPAETAYHKNINLLFNEIFS